MIQTINSLGNILTYTIGLPYTMAVVLPIGLTRLGGGVFPCVRETQLLTRIRPFLTVGITMNKIRPTVTIFTETTAGRFLGMNFSGKQS